MTRNANATRDDQSDEVAAERPVNEERLLHALREATKSLTKREELLLHLRLQDLNTEQIAYALGEDLQVVRLELNRLMAKVRYRLKERASLVKATTRSGRLEAFNELQHRLGLTSAQAAAWQNSIREARR